MSNYFSTTKKASKGGREKLYILSTFSLIIILKRITYFSFVWKSWTFYCHFNPPPSLLQGLVYGNCIMRPQTRCWEELLHTHGLTQLSSCRTCGRASDPSPVHMKQKTCLKVLYSLPVSQVSSGVGVQLKLISSLAQSN